MKSSHWRYIPFSEALADQTARGHKLQQKHFAVNGQIPVVDQGSSFIAGYTDDISLAWNGELPLVIFGDHTRAIKYVDFEPPPET